MKHTYIQPAIFVVEVEMGEIVCTSPAEPQQVDVPMGGGTATEFDAPRLRLWGEE